MRAGTLPQSGPFSRALSYGKELSQRILARKSAQTQLFRRGVLFFDGENLGCCARGALCVCLIIDQIREMLKGVSRGAILGGF